MLLPHALNLGSGISCTVRLAGESDLEQICEVFEEHTGVAAQKETIRQFLRTRHGEFRHQYVVAESGYRLIAFGSRSQDTIKLLLRRPADLYKGSGAAVLKALEVLIRGDNWDCVQLRANLINGVGNLSKLIKFYLDQGYSCPGGYTMKKNLL